MSYKTAMEILQESIRSHYAEGGLVRQKFAGGGKCSHCGSQFVSDDRLNAHMATCKKKPSGAPATAPVPATKGITKVAPKPLTLIKKASPAPAAVATPKTKRQELKDMSSGNFDNHLASFTDNEDTTVPAGGARRLDPAKAKATADTLGGKKNKHATFFLTAAQRREFAEDMQDKKNQDNLQNNKVVTHKFTGTVPIWKIDNTKTKHAGKGAHERGKGDATEIKVRHHPHGGSGRPVANTDGNYYPNHLENKGYK